MSVCLMGAMPPKDENLYDEKSGRRPYGYDGQGMVQFAFLKNVIKRRWKKGKYEKLALETI
ncbi:hypothetical protein [uncultured Nitrospira sp.]|uniref:hypothetical protein n=1 Tax=uncultured Nitrospira sp. TaxID=157176 RepID=UPI003140B0FB